MGIMDLSRTWLMTFWRVCYLDMPNLSNMFAQRGDQIAFHALHVVQIILVLEVWAVYFGKHFECLPCACEEVAWIFESIQRFDHYTQTGSCSIVGRKGQVLTDQFQLGLVAPSWES